MQADSRNLKDPVSTAVSYNDDVADGKNVDLVEETK